MFLLSRVKNVEPFVRMKIMICVVIFLNGVGAYAVALNYPTILKSIIVNTHPHMPRNDLIALASSTKSWLDALSAMLMFVLLPVLGGLGDLVGRKPILVYCTISTLIAVVVVTLGYQTNSLWMLFVAKFAGYASQSMIYIGNGYIGDIANPQSKAKDFGKVMATYGLATAVAPLLFGALTKFYGLIISLLVGGVICFLNIVVTGLFLKESLSFGQARALAVNDMNGPVSDGRTRTPRLIHRFNPFRTWGVILNRHNLYVLCLSLVYITYAIGESDILDTAYLYTNYRYNWDNAEYSLYMALTGTAMSLYLGLALGFLVKRYGEKKCLLAALYIGGFAHMVYAFAFTWWIFIFAVPFSCIATSASPTLQTLVARNVPERNMGSALGALGSLFSLSQFVGALVMENIFAYFISSNSPFEFPGAHFALGSLLLLGGAIWCTFLFQKYRHGSEAKYLEEVAPIMQADDLSQRKITIDAVENLE